MYLYTDNIIEEIEWDINNPKMYLKNIKLESCGDYEKSLYKWNENNKNIYYIGSYEGCGCGWRNINRKLFKKEIKHYLKEINNLKLEIHNINNENMQRELIKNKIKYSENEIAEFVNFRKKIYKNKIETCEYNIKDNIKDIIKKVRDRNDLFNLLKINNDNKAFIIVCWEGDQGKETNKKIHLNIEKIKNTNYEFRELVKYILRE
jgi:arsenate reductase-like glutaredoxin family protein